MTQLPESLEKLVEKFYTNMPEPADLEEVEAFSLKCYQLGLDDQGRKANSGRLLYQDGYRQGVDDVIKEIPNEVGYITQDPDDRRIIPLKEQLRNKFLK